MISYIILGEKITNYFTIKLKNISYIQSMFKIIKLFIFAYMIYSSILVTFGYARDYEKGQQIISNIVSEDCKKIKNAFNLS